MTGRIFDCKEFSLHDGPGSRVTVFFKGCPLHCRWCHNPEGLSAVPQLMVKKTLCTHCGRCRLPCSHSDCAPFGRCLHACHNGLISVSGEEISADDLLHRLQGPLSMVSEDGGITFSGGEPLMQPEFLLELCAGLSGIHKALQTSGYASPAIFRAAVDAVDYVMLDLKLFDEAEHLKQTGVSNRLILENFEYLRQSGKEFLIRTPLIPGITDTPENLSALSELIGNDPWERLDNNPFAGAKYAMLGLRFPLEEEL